MKTGAQVRVRVPAHVLWRELDGESVLLDLDRGYYYGLDEVGSRVWLLLGREAEIEPVVQTLLAEYDVPEEELRADVWELVEDLAAHQLLEIDGS